MEHEFEQRQLQQMRNLIERLKRKEVGLSKFVTDQWAIIEMLETTDKQWKDDYLSLVNAIETIFAIALDATDGKLGPKDVKAINETLDKMISLLSIKIGS